MLLLPIRRHGFAKTSIQARLFTGDKLFPQKPGFDLVLRNENMPFPYPNSKENSLVADTQENSLLLQLWLQVAISDKTEAWKEGLVPSETSLRDVLVATFSCKNKKQKSPAEGLLHSPHNKQQHFSITAASCWRQPTICSPNATLSCGLETLHLLITLRAEETEGRCFNSYCFSTRHKALRWETRTHASCVQQH